MVKKRARLSEDNDPLTSTDKVLQGFEELSKSTSTDADKSVRQEVKDDAASKTNKPTSRQVKKSTSQPASKSTIRQTRRKKTSPSNTSKPKQVNKLASQQDENIESQEVNQNPKKFNKLTSQQHDAEDIGNKVSDEIDSNPSFEQPNKSESQQVSNKGSQEVSQKLNKFDKLASQQVKKSEVRKSTFQLSSTILEQLDRLHLELQLELGKQDAPYKEVIVEEAIAQLLEVAAENRSELVESLFERQGQRK